MRVKEQVRQCIVFICNQKGSPIGTAFLVTIPSKQKEESYAYLVTAKHVAKRVANKPFYTRLNKKNGSFGYGKGGGVEWFYHPTDDSIDVAVIPYSPSQELYEYATVSTNTFLSDEIIHQDKIGVGDEVFIVGLFAHASGSQRNQPIVRIGNVAMIPDEPIPTELGSIEAYLIEARSIGGLSGSPAFVRERISISRERFYLMGLMHGHWDIPTDRKNDLLVSDDSLKTVNMGIAIVIPAKKILEVLNHPKLVEIREEFEKLKS